MSSQTMTEQAPMNHHGSSSPVESSVNDGRNTTTNHTNNDSTTTTTTTTTAAALSLQELNYSSSSFHAICKPVTLTMILSALAVIYIQEPNTRSQQEEAYTSSYTVWSTSTASDGSGGGIGKNVGVSLANSLIIVCVICVMTFGIVLLYKFKCFKCLMGYMMLSSAMLLGFLGAELLRTSVNTYELNLDTLSFYACLYNFGIVGVFAIFWQQGGIPTYVTQGYLVMTSVLLAWQLSFFDEWTTWTLLVMLALYDLCAVLTPCGPLKALINVMSRDDSPGMVPGLLYEAQLPATTQRPNRDGNNASTNNRQQQQQQRQGQQHTNSRNNSSSNSSQTAQEAMNSSTATNNITERQHSSFPSTNDDGEYTGIEMAPTNNNDHTRSASTTNTSSSATRPATTRMLPLAIAKVYKLRYLDHPGIPPYIPPEPPAEGETNRRHVIQEYTPEQLTTIVECVFPRRGGRIDAEPDSDGANEPCYIVRDRHGEIKRTLVVDRHGKVFERRASTDDDDSGIGGRTSIKLGLGDFIFYSLLVSRAALYSFTTFAACTLVILTGLGSTLVLLSVFGKALPALPISIFMAVSFYLCTRILVEPWIETVFQHANYV